MSIPSATFLIHGRAPGAKYERNTTIPQKVHKKGTYLKVHRNLFSLSYPETQMERKSLKSNKWMSTPNVYN